MCAHTGTRMPLSTQQELMLAQFSFSTVCTALYEQCVNRTYEAVSWTGWSRSRVILRGSCSNLTCIHQSISKEATCTSSLLYASRTTSLGGGGGNVAPPPPPCALKYGTATGGTRSCSDCVRQREVGEDDLDGLEVDVNAASHDERRPPDHRADPC